MLPVGLDWIGLVDGLCFNASSVTHFKQVTIVVLMFIVDWYWSMLVGSTSTVGI